MARLLNRTLIVGPVQLGAAVPWANLETLQLALDRAEGNSYFECEAIRNRAERKQKVSVGLSGFGK